MVLQGGIKKLKYSCVDLEYDTSSYGRTTDWSAEEKQGAGYQGLLASITARLAAAHSKSYLGTYEGTAERSKQILLTSVG